MRRTTPPAAPAPTRRDSILRRLLPAALVVFTLVVTGVVPSRTRAAEPVKASSATGDGSGADTADGGDGDNLITLAGGNDVIVAGSGNDVIDGRRGFDTCNAGGGTNSVSRCEA
jgi:hypothetical protein